MPKSTLTSKGQVTVPKVIRDRFDLKEGDQLEFAVEETGRIVLRPSRHGDGVTGVLRDYAPEKPVSVEAMREAVRRRAASKAGRTDG